MAGEGAAGRLAPPLAALAALPQPRSHPLVVAALRAPSPDHPVPRDEAVQAELRDLITRHALSLARMAALAESAVEAVAHEGAGMAVDFADALEASEDERAGLLARCGGSHARFADPILDAARAYAVDRSESDPEDALAAWEALLQEIESTSKND